MTAVAPQTRSIATVAVRSLTISSAAGTIVQPIDFSIDAGETLALIGESGSGKSMTARAIVGLLPDGVTATGQVSFGERSITLPQPSGAWSRVRGQDAVLLLQDPFTSLSPLHTCGKQIALGLRAVTDGSRRTRASARSEVERLLAEVRLPARVARQYPHELSGGMRQRVAIAASLAARPRLLIADEPTTALDASNQADILDLLDSLRKSRTMALLLISHDLGVVHGRADRVLVMQHGHVVEQGATDTVLRSPRHPYTRALLAANPSTAVFRGAPTSGDASSADVAAAAWVAEDVAGAADEPGAPGRAEAIRVDSLTKSFGVHVALDDVSLHVDDGEIVSLVGESGSGKSTLARVIAGLEIPDAGSLRIDGAEVGFGRAGRTPQQLQIVFQDPNSTLNPAKTVRQTLVEALGVARRPASDLGALLDEVGLDAQLSTRKPARLSGGQRQRVAIARALAPRPRVLLCDEIVSALDVSIQAQILRLIVDLRDRLGISVLFISHDLSVVGQISDRIAVMHAGRIVETGPTAAVLSAPRDDYTRMLVDAAERQLLPAGFSTVEPLAATPTAEPSHEQEPKP